MINAPGAPNAVAGATIHCIRCNMDLPRSAFYTSSLDQNSYTCKQCVRRASNAKRATPEYAHASHVARTSRIQGAANVSLADVQRAEKELSLACFLTGKTRGVVLARTPILLHDGVRVDTRGLYLPLVAAKASELNRMLDSVVAGDDARVAAEDVVARVFFGNTHARVCTRFLALSVVAPAAPAQQPAAPDPPSDQSSSPASSPGGDLGGVLESPAKRARVAAVGD